jgi:hypothetical protein
LYSSKIDEKFKLIIDHDGENLLNQIMPASNDFFVGAADAARGVAPHIHIH